MGGAGTYPLTIVGEDGTLVVFGTTELVLECTPPPPPCCETLEITVGPHTPSLPECYTSTPSTVEREVTFSACDIQWRIYRLACDSSETLYDSGSGVAPVVVFSHALSEGEAWHAGQLCPMPTTNFRLAYWCGALDPDVDPESGSIDLLAVVCA
jgi:hypothetical protein